MKRFRIRKEISKHMIRAEAPDFRKCIKIDALSQAMHTVWDKYPELQTFLVVFSEEETVSTITITGEISFQDREERL